MTALHLGWWVASRAAGIVAFGLVAASVISGLALANRLGSPALRARLRDLHEPRAMAGLVALALHGALLLRLGGARTVRADGGLALARAVYLKR